MLQIRHRCAIAFDRQDVTFTYAGTKIPAQIGATNRAISIKLRRGIRRGSTRFVLLGLPFHGAGLPHADPPRSAGIWMSRLSSKRIGKSRSSAASAASIQAGSKLWERTIGCRRMQECAHSSRTSRSARSPLPTRSWQRLFRSCHPILSIG